MALIKKPGCKVWYAQYRVNGKSWTRSTGETSRRRAEAKVPQLRRLAELHRQLPKDSLKLKTLIIRELDWIETTVSVREADRIDDALSNFARWAGNVLLEKISTAMLADYQRHRIEKAAHSTVQKEIYWILRMLRRNGLTIQKPQPIRGRTTKHRAFTPDELRRFFAACNPAHKILFMVMLATGARPAELIPSSRSNHVALLKTEVDVENNLIEIRGAKQRSEQEEVVRRVRIPEEFMEELVVYARTIPGPHIFPKRNSSLNRTFDRILKRAGIEKIDILGHKVTAHSFRHTYATLMAEALGGNPFILKQALGHSQITTTDRYCHPQAPAKVIDLSAYLGRVKGSCKKSAPGAAEAS